MITLHAFLKALNMQPDYGECLLHQCYSSGVPSFGPSPPDALVGQED